MKKSSKRRKNHLNELSFIFKARDLNNLTPRHFLPNIVPILQDTKVESLQEILNQLFKFPVAKRCLSYSNQKRKLLGAYRRLPELGSLEKEVIYLVTLLKVNSRRINSFAFCKKEYEKKLILGEYGEARLILNNVEKKHGATIWGLINELVLTYEMQGYESLKDARTLLRTEIPNEYVIFLLDQVSNSVDVPIPEVYLKNKSSIIHEFRGSGEVLLADTLSAYLLPVDYDPKRRLLNHLMNFTGFPVIDQFLYFDQALREAVLLNELDLSSQVQFEINQFYDLLTDYRSPILYDSKSTKLEIDSQVSRVVSDYTMGRYSKTIELIPELLSADLRYMSLLEVYCKSLVLLGIGTSAFPENSIIDSMCKSIISLVRLESDFDNCSNKLEMILIKYSTHSWPQSLFLQLNSISPNIYSRYREFAVHKAIFSDTYDTPKAVVLFEMVDEVEHFESIAELLDLSSQERAEVPQMRYLKHSIYAEKGSLIVEIEPKDPHLLPFEHHKIKASSYINTGEILKACQYTSEQCIENERLYTIMPITQILDLLEVKSFDVDEASSISIPVLYSIYSRYIEGDKDFALSLSLEDFLDELGVCMPSEYYEGNKKLSNLEKYFLEHVCVPAIIDSLDCFKSEEDLFSERLRILSVLKSNADADTKSNYQVEIDSIIDQAIINRSSVEVGKSKIHVDIESLKSAKYRYLEAIFYEYKNYRGDEEISENSLLQVGGEGVDASYISKMKDTVLLKLVSEFIHDFAANGDYGLNKYLSADIRHGFFINQLRTRLENLHIVSDRGDEGYEKISYWQEMFSMINPEIHEDVAKCLQDFSQKIDKKLLEGMERIGISIRKGDEEKLFNYYIGVEVYEDIKLKADSSDSFELFYFELESIAWQVTDQNLRNARVWLHEHFLAELEICIDELQQCLLPAKSGVTMQELDDAIKSARNGLKDDIETVMGWLTRDAAIKLNDLPMHKAIEVSLSILADLHSPKKVYSNFEYKICGDNSEDIVLSGPQFKHLIIGLLTAYNNALYHGINNEKNILAVNYTHQLGSWVISVSNQFDRRRVESVQNALSEYIQNKVAEDNLFATTEGGTGLRKIYSYLRQAFEDVDVQFICSDSYQFEVNIES